MRILAFDPGRKPNSFAYCFLVDGVVVQYGLIQPIAALKPGQFASEAKAFIKRIRGLVQKFAPDVIIAERFMDRGGSSKGTTGEYVNIMLGLMQASIFEHEIELVMPATWKGWLARTYLIGKPTKKQRTVAKNMLTHLRVRFPAECKPKEKSKQMIIHEADACGIALWRYETESPKERMGSIDGLIGRSTVKIIV